MRQLRIRLRETKSCFHWLSIIPKKKTIYLLITGPINEDSLGNLWKIEVRVSVRPDWQKQN